MGSAVYIFSSRAHFICTYPVSSEVGQYAFDHAFCSVLRWVGSCKDRFGINWSGCFLIAYVNTLLYKNILEEQIRQAYWRPVSLGTYFSSSIVSRIIIEIKGDPRKFLNDAYAGFSVFFFTKMHTNARRQVARDGYAMMKYGITDIFWQFYVPDYICVVLNDITNQNACRARGLLA